MLVIGASVAVPVIVGGVVISTAAVIVADIVGVVVVAYIVNMAVYDGAVGIIGIGPVVAVISLNSAR